MREHFDSHEERADLYSYFVEQAIRLLDSSGQFGMIVSNKFIRAKYGRPLRDVLESRATVTRLADFAGANVFVGATVRTIIILAMPTAKKPASTEYVPVPNPEVLSAISTGRISVNDHAKKTRFRLEKNSLSANEWRGTVNCCVLNNFLSGGILHDSVFEGPSFDDECDFLVAA